MAKGERVKYAHINHFSTSVVNGHEYLFFTTWHGQYYEWQRGSNTINVKSAPSYESPDLDCFSLSYAKSNPSMRDAKICIMDYINER
jgi:hypothetical protein